MSHSVISYSSIPRSRSGERPEPRRAAALGEAGCGGKTNITNHHNTHTDKHHDTSHNNDDNDNNTSTTSTTTTTTTNNNDKSSC